MFVIEHFPCGPAVNLTPYCKSIFHCFSEALGNHWEPDPLTAFLGATDSLYFANKSQKIHCLVWSGVSKKKVNLACLEIWSWSLVWFVVGRNYKHISSGGRVCQLCLNWNYFFLFVTVHTYVKKNCFVYGLILRISLICLFMILEVIANIYTSMNSNTVHDDMHLYREHRKEEAHVCINHSFGAFFF